MLEQNGLAKGAGRLLPAVRGRWAQPYVMCVVLVASGLWFNLCKHLLQAPCDALAQEGVCSPTREQSQEISHCLHLFSVLQGHSLVFKCWFAWLAGSPASLKPLLQAGLIRLKNQTLH